MAASNHPEIDELNKNYEHGKLGVKCVPPNYFSDYPGICIQPSDTNDPKHRNWIGHIAEKNAFLQAERIGSHWSVNLHS